MINKVLLIGHLGQSPELRRLESGAAVAKFSIATSEAYKDKNTDEWHEQTEWHTIIAWRHLAERAERDLKRGSKVYIEGKLTHRKWTDDKGTPRYATEVVARTIKLLDKRPRNEAPMPTSELPASTVGGGSPLGSGAAADKKEGDWNQAHLQPGAELKDDDDTPF